MPFYALAFGLSLLHSRRALTVAITACWIAYFTFYALDSSWTLATTKLSLGRVDVRIHDAYYASLFFCGMRWLRLSEQLRAGDKWIPAGFLGRFDALLGCDAGRA